MSQEKKINPFEHHHDHGLGHNDDPKQHHRAEDPAQQSMNDALGVAFKLLKFAMIVVAIIYLTSGFYKVPQGQVAQHVRFGKPIKISEKSGLYFAFPYPIDRIEMIEVRPRSIEIRSLFWYSLSGEGEGRPGPLNPIFDGSLITADLSLLHAKVSAQYQITDVESYIRHRPPKLKIGKQDNETNAATAKLVMTAVQEGLILAASQTNADDFQRRRSIDQVAKNTRTHAQEIINRMQLGIRINAITFPDVKYPLAVQPSVNRVIEAETEKAKLIETAKAETTRKLGEIAGPAYRELQTMIKAYESADNQQNKRKLEAQLFKAFDEQQLEDRTPIRGKASQVMQEALAFRTQISQQSRGLAERFSSSSGKTGALQQFKAHPRIYMNRRWQEAIERMLSAKKAEYIFLRGQPYIVLGKNPKVEKARNNETGGTNVK